MAKKGNFIQNPAEFFISAAETGDNAPGSSAPDTGMEIPKGYKLVKESKTTRMQLLMRPLTKQALKRTADAKGVSMNDLVNDIIEEYLERAGEL